MKTSESTDRNAAGQTERWREIQREREAALLECLPWTREFRAARAREREGCRDPVPLDPLALYSPDELAELGYAGGDGRPYCSNGRVDGFNAKRRPAADAWAFYRHVRLNPAQNAVGIVLDNDGGVDAVRAAVDDGRVLPPSVEIVRVSNERAFCVWFLAVPVHRYSAARPGPQVFLAMVTEYYAHETDADPSYNGSLARNPIVAAADPAFRVERLPGPGYSLGELAAPIPRGWRMPTRARLRSAEGRNCSLFLALCRFAGSATGRSADLGLEAVRLNAEFGTPLAPVEVVHIVHHVERYRDEWEAAGWYRPDWIERQRARGRRSGAARSERADDRALIVVPAGAARSGCYQADINQHQINRGPLAAVRGASAESGALALHQGRESASAGSSDPAGARSCSKSPDVIDVGRELSTLEYLRLVGLSVRSDSLPPRLAEAVRLAADGRLTVRAIAQRVGVHRVTLARWRATNAAGLSPDALKLLKRGLTTVERAAALGVSGRTIRRDRERVRRMRERALRERIEGKGG